MPNPWRSTLGDLAIERILNQITREMPPFGAHTSFQMNGDQLTETWLASVTLKGASIPTTLPNVLQPSINERGYQILIFLIQSYAHLELLATSANNPTYDEAKTMILNSLRQAMATRTQPRWASPSAILASYIKPDGTPRVVTTTTGESAESAGIMEWYEERQRRGEVGAAVDVLGSWIERDVMLMPTENSVKAEAGQEMFDGPVSEVEMLREYAFGAGYSGRHASVRFSGGSHSAGTIYDRTSTSRSPASGKITHASISVVQPAVTTSPASLRHHQPMQSHSGLFWFTDMSYTYKLSMPAYLITMCSIMFLKTHIGPDDTDTWQHIEP
ncbi:hypothetical protein OPT61_g688 [Boeremia exigua]|uniref:Uncharacterized protein n=1 Tax=Boeremia exigua TaxID=749465 RepID=A0ACC2ISX2_9PLEO|nr:hypothetical protein OPT61_g688 [Boeremia exigua]